MNCLDYFKQLCSVPHGSGNTKQVSDLLFSFCKEHGCECVQDELGNVIAHKAGSAGRENEEPVILQAHMDMVCVAEDGVNKNLAAEPIELVFEGDYLRANGTSLGADDGIGVAMIMNVLADDNLSHPPIEAVFTVDEETNMCGADNLDMSLIKGKRMINLDHGCEGAITVCCAGGTRLEVVFPCVWEVLSDGQTCYRVSVGGLKSGHSGCDIADNRANAARLLARIIYGLSLKMQIRICDWMSGKADNVIPPSATAIVSVPEESRADFERLAMKHEILFSREYPKETGLAVKVETCEKQESGVVPKMSKSLARFISSVPDGLRKMSEDFPEIAQTSSNAGISKLKQDGMHVRMLLRSSVPEELDELKEMVRQMALHDGGKVTECGSYPAWVYRKESPLCNTACSVYEEMTGKRPIIEATHGGLESGIFDSRIDDFDCIAMGPEMQDIHSPYERLNIRSAERTYEWLVRILGKI